MGDFKSGYAATIAPIIAKNKVITAVAGGEYGIRGFIDAYDAATGKRAWRFYTVPASGEPGNDTWAGDSWKVGGAGVWVTGAYDPELNLLYYGIGNPGPDYHSETARATTSTATRSSPSTPTRAPSAGTTSSPRTIFTTGTPPKSLSWPIDDRRSASQGGDVRQSQRLLLHPGPDERKGHHGQTVRDNDLGQGDRTGTGAQSFYPVTFPTRRDRSRVRIWSAAPTSGNRASIRARRPSS